MTVSNSAIALVLQIRIRPDRKSLQSLDKISTLCRFYKGIREHEEGRAPHPETQGGIRENDSPVPVSRAKDRLWQPRKVL